MKRFFYAFFLFCMPLLLAACSFSQSDVNTPEILPTTQEDEVPQPELTQEDLVTRNVSYTGILEEGGITIYQQGSHRLTLGDGKMILLDVNADAGIDLDLYVGKMVRVKGDVQPTMEAGGTIMNVQAIHWIRQDADAGGAAREIFVVLCGGEARCPENQSCLFDEEGVGICQDSKEAMAVDMEEEDEEAVVEEESTLEEDAVEDLSEEEPEDAVAGIEEAVVLPTSASYERSVALMEEEDYAPEHWTQEYCTEHVGFCVPVHKNWYYKSFGAMTSVLWHVEMGAQAVDQMGDGPLLVELKTGSLSALGVTDGAVEEVGMRVVGYRTWDTDRYFEVSAPAGLVEPVVFVTQGIRRIEK